MLFFCNSDHFSFKINGGRIGQLLLRECHSLNQDGFAEVNRQWPGSPTGVITLEKAKVSGWQSSHSRINEQAMWGEQCQGWHPDRAGTATALGFLRNRGHSLPAEQQRLCAILVPINVVSPLPARLWDCQFCVTSLCQEAAVQGRGAPPHSAFGLLQGLVALCKTAQFNPFTYKRDLFGKF